MNKKTLLWSNRHKIELEIEKDSQPAKFVKLLLDGKEYAEQIDPETKKLTSDDLFQKANQYKRDYYSKFLSREFENLVILTGAGTSYGIGAETKGKTMSGLWDIVEKSEIDLKTLCTDINYDIQNMNLESLLTQASKALAFNIADEAYCTKISDLINKIEKIIKNECTLALPEHSPHEEFLRKVTKRHLKHPRTKIFTTNYDTLFEQAADNSGQVIVDGFSFSSHRIFRGFTFDYDLVLRENSRIKGEENYIRNVFHLYKLHGSLDWYKEKELILKGDTKDKASLMIYPANDKYESSFENPFFEMMSRFQKNLREPNTLLISIGFSLADKHIRNMVKEALTQNTSLQIMIVDYTIDDNEHFNWFKDKAEKDTRILLISEIFSDFASNYPDVNSRIQDEIVKEIYYDEN